MRCLLVTGGAGFIGSCLVRHLVQNRLARVVTLDKLTYAGHRSSLRAVLDDPLHEFVQGDIGDAPLVASLLAAHRPQAILHLAAESHVDRSILAPAAFIDTNVTGTFRLLQAALDYWRSLDAEAQQRFRFLQISTDEVFGSCDEPGRFAEDAHYRPTSPYSASKAAGDHLADAFTRTYGLPTIRTYCSNNYGPYQFPEKLIPLMTVRAVRRQPLPVYGDGQQVRDWLHVEDHCRALLAVLARGTVGEAYNIAGKCERTNLSVVQRICEIIDELRPETGQPARASLISLVEDRPGHDRRYALDVRKIERALGWRPTVDFDRGLRETVAWYLEHSEWVAEVMVDVQPGESVAP
ncbi:MAG: dTDP-glucose 4,6-dehydratase [Planctomycetota bacterium]|nr:MAG: dTDP-glucose 4,6-dehydratase [Planctomycetota bacterium]